MVAFCLALSYVRDVQDSDITFGGYTVKRRERVLQGPGGTAELSTRSFDILMVLLAKPDETVSKDELLDAVWPGVTVEENTLHVHISALRKALGPEMIATVHGRGYKYAGPPPDETQGTSGSPASRKPVIVVLPFDNLSGDPEQQYFSDGMSGDITDRLVRFREFSVIGQYSAGMFRAAAPDFAAIRERLKADFVVTGSIRRGGDSIRVTVRLADSLREEAIWAERYDRPISGLFSLQDEISELVASAIARHLEVEINVRSTGQSPTSLSSYELMLQGYWHFKKLSRQGTMAARECFERSVALDPRNAEAVAWLGVTYSESWVQDFRIEDAVRGAALAAQAVALDPASATCYGIQAWALTCINDLEGALRASERGMQLNPGDPEVVIKRALTFVYDGKLAEARGLFEQARKLEPLPPLWFGEFEGVAAFAEGRYEDCLSGVEPIPNVAWDVMYALACYGHLSWKDKALRTRRRIAEKGPAADFRFGASHEPFRDSAIRERLMEGLDLALSF